MSTPFATWARSRSRDRRRARGFTLLEMLVSLIVGTLIVGGVMGLISSSMQYKFRLKDKSLAQPILETAAQAILADPKRIGDRYLREPKGSPCGFGQYRSIREKRAETASLRVMLD